ncbi:hypothetical protein BH11PSE11_BH11PSE11_10290 [soil metagenome]
MARGRDKSAEVAASHGAATAHASAPALRSVELDDLLDALERQLCALPDVAGGAINLINEAGDALVTAQIKLPDEFAGVQKGYKGFRYSFDHPDVNVIVFQSGKAAAVFEKDLDQYAETTRLRFERWQMCSLLVIPFTALQSDGTVEIIGTVSLFSQERTLSLDLVKRVDAITASASKQIQTCWNQHQAIERRKIVGAMSANIQQFFSCVSDINKLASVESVYESIAKEFLQHFRFNMISILLAEGDALEIVHTGFSQKFKHLAPDMAAWTSNVKYSFNVSDGQAGYVYTHNQHFLIDDVMTIRHLPMSAKDRSFIDLLGTVRTLLIVPIRLNDSVIGTITLATLKDPVYPTETDLTLIELLASFISTAIRNAKQHLLVQQESSEIGMLNRDLKEQMVLLNQVASKDRLTGLNNFGNFEEELKRRTSEYSRAGNESTLAVILIDVDHFKQFNDAYGHLAGNQVLQEVGSRISSCARDMDFVARYGGEEFIMLLPQCDLESAVNIAERVRCKIADDAFIIDGQARSISVSGGCAQFLPAESARDFIFRADAALYCAKRNGRNRIEVAEESPGVGIALH